MSPPAFTARTLRTLIVGLATALFLLVVSSRPVDAHAIREEMPRIAVVSAFAPELAILQEETEGVAVQLALDCLTSAPLGHTEGFP